MFTMEKNQVADVGKMDFEFSLKSVYIPAADARSAPQPRGGHSFIYDAKLNRFLVFGGLISNGDNEECTNDVYQLTIEEESLVRFNEAIIPGMLDPNLNRKKGFINASHSNCSKDIHESENFIAVWNKIEYSGTPPPARWCHTTALQDRSMILFGGWSYSRTDGVGSRSTFFNDMYIMNIDTFVWTELQTTGSIPRPRCQCASFLVGGGGERYDTKLKIEKKEKNYESNLKDDLSHEIKNENLHRSKGIASLYGISSSDSSPSSSSSSRSSLNTSSAPSLEHSYNSKEHSNSSEEYKSIYSPPPTQPSPPLPSNLPNPPPTISSSNTTSGYMDSQKHEYPLKSGYSDTRNHEYSNSSKLTNLSTSNYNDNSKNIEEVLMQKQLLDLTIHSSLMVEKSVVKKSDEFDRKQENNERNVSNDINDEEIKDKYNDTYINTYNNKEMNDDKNGINMNSMDEEIKLRNLQPDCSRNFSDISKGYLVIYGGSCHNEDVNNVHTNFRSMVMDYHDFKVLDLDTLIWLPIVCAYPKSRGGIHALVECSKGWLLSGGMQTEAASDMPRFKNDVTYIIPNFKQILNSKSPIISTELQIPIENKNTRLINKFFSVKA
jgi:hypothetical protein